MDQSQDNNWTLTLHTTPGSIPSSDSELFVRIISQNGDEAEINRTLENISPIFVLPRLANGIECNDSPDSFIESEEELSNYICAFDNTGTGLVTLFIDVTTEHPSDLTLNVTECFIGDECQTSQYRFDETEETLQFNISVLKNQNTKTMQYLIEVHTPFEIQPVRTITIEFVDKDSFSTLMSIDDLTTTFVNVSEQGRISLSSTFLVETKLGNGKELRNDVFMQMLKLALEKSNCQIIGQRMTPDYQESQQYEYNQDAIRATKSCEMVATINGSKVEITSNVDWSSEFEVNSSNGNGLTFYLMETEELQIRFNWPISNNSHTIVIENTSGENIVFNLETYKNNPTVFSSGRCNAFSQNKNSLEAGIDNSKLEECFESVIDKDGVEYLGMKLVYNEKNLTVLCTSAKITNWDILDWIDGTSRLNDGCQVSGDFESIKTQETYNTLKFSIIACDLRCEVYGTMEYELLINGSATWEGATIEVIDGDREIWELAKSIFKGLLICVVIVFLVLVWFKKIYRK